MVILYCKSKYYILIHSLYSISILITCSFLLAHACVRPFALTCIYIPPTSPKGYYPSVPILLLGSLGIGKRYFESRSNSYFLNPFLDGLLISPEISKVSFELLKGFSVTPETLLPGCLSEVGQLVPTMRCSWSIPCILCHIILSCCTMWYARCRAVPPPVCGCLLLVPTHG